MNLKLKKPIFWKRVKIWKVQRRSEIEKGERYISSIGRILLRCEQYNCSDFWYESNGIFVPGVDFFSSDKFRLFNKPFLTEFFISFERYYWHELKFEKIFYLWSFFVKLWGFKDCYFGQSGTINAGYISRYKRVSG